MNYFFNDSRKATRSRMSDLLRINPIGGMVDMAGGRVLMSDFLQIVSCLVSILRTTTSASVSFMSMPATIEPSFMVMAMGEYPGVSLALGTTMDSKM